ncbi:MAG: LegC family aminotransferase [Desulfobacteraceae bacterium]|nr:LegC family aminotransferase [Desulfobacteraceae bacterium]
MFSELIKFIRELYNNPGGAIPLHAPTFTDLERRYVLDTIDSTFVSSVGEYVNRFEQNLAGYTGAARAVATVNGTTALLTALRLVGVGFREEVITQSLTFVATANAISHLGAHPAFVDVDRDTMGLSPQALDAFLSENAEKSADGFAYNKNTGNRFAAVVPMHTFGHPCRIEEIVEIASGWGIPVVEDAAEALGSWISEKHCGTLADIGILSFNGNKVITSGGGGAILTNNQTLGERAKHLTTTARVDHPWEFEHDEIGYNFRMPNLNAALACAQLERLGELLAEKRKLALAYKKFFDEITWADFAEEPEGSRSNYWLCAIVLEEPAEREAMLEALNAEKIQARPVWKLMTELPMYADCQKGPIPNAGWLRQRLVNLPSGVQALV